MNQDKENSPSVILENGTNGEKVKNPNAKTEPRNKDRGQTTGKIQRHFCFKSPGKILVFLLICAAVTCFGALIFGFFHFPPNKKAIIDIGVDPCDDFYEFACGPRNSQLRNFSKDQDDLFDALVQKILGNSHTENRAEEKAQNFYRSCIKVAADPELESLLWNEELNNMLEKLEKIPPASFQEKLQLLQNEYGLSPFFFWGVDRDFEDSDRNTIMIVQNENTALGVDDPEETDQFTSLLNQSAHFKTMMSKILGNRLDFTAGSDDFAQLMDLEMEIRGMMQTPMAYESNVLNRYNSMNLTQLEDLAGFLNWKKFFNNGFQNLNQSSKIDDSEKIVVWCSQFLSRLSKKLTHLQNSPDGQKLLNKYLIWEAGKELFGQMFIAADSATEMSKTNSTANPVALSTCSAITQQHFDAAVASMLRRHFLKSIPDFETRWLKIVQEMAENIREELILVLKESELLDEKSRDGAIKKARKTRVLIGFPEGVKNRTLLKQFYEFCPKMNESDFIGNLINVLKAEIHRNLKTLRDPADKNGTFGWPNQGAQILVSNAFNIQDLNAILAPVRNLLPPHFYPESPQSYNYGRTGFIIAHEFFHGFSKDGSNFDGDGKFQSQSRNQSLWQTEETREKMENRSSCLVRQYSKFEYSDPKGEFLNGTHTLEENFADNGGLDVATRAVFRLLQKNNMSSSSRGKNEKNQTLDRNRSLEERMFFASFALNWCTNEPSFPKDPHAPGKFRILGALQNSKAFSEAFQCPPKSLMNPDEKCSIF